MLQAAAWTLTPEEAAVLEAGGDFFAAGLLADGKASPALMHARAIASYLSHCDLPLYAGEPLYPVGRSIWLQSRAQVIWHHYVAVDLALDTGLASERAGAATTETARRAYEKVRLFCESWPRGGGLYTHSIINYGRVLAEGLAGYAERLQARLATSEDESKRELYQALLVVLTVVDTYRQRVAGYLASLSFEGPDQEANRRRLAEAFGSGLPMRPALGFSEAMAATNLLYALDGSDNLGRFDQFMWPYYRESMENGTLTREQAVTLVRGLWRYVDDCEGWNVALGGSTRQGREASNGLTLVCLEAGRGMRRPNLALRLRRDTPERVWEEAIATLATGTGLPALYGEENYLRAIDTAHLNLSEADKHDFAFGGCTELMVHGCSAVGSLDGDFSVITCLERTLGEHLEHCLTLEELLEAFEGDLERGIAGLTAEISKHQAIRGQWHPQLIRTLLVDDCIDNGRTFYDGGARYNWSVVNIVGLSNAVDSLAAVRRAVYEDKVATAAELLAALEADFEGCEGLHRYLEQSPRFGNDEPAVDGLAVRLSSFIYREFKRYAPWRGGRFICGTLMFVTYGAFGRLVGATPDGRRAGTPVADSAGPVQGRDRHGPTAMLRSVAALSQVDAPGTLVVNLRLARRFFRTAAGREKLKALLRTYFALGGLQLQLNVVDQAVLQDAIAHPERHGDLIVRVGGYSEYFNRLEDSVKLAVLERTQHG